MPDDNENMWVIRYYMSGKYYYLDINSNGGSFLNPERVASFKECYAKEIARKMRDHGADMTTEAILLSQAIMDYKSFDPGEFPESNDPLCNHSESSLQENCKPLSRSSIADGGSDECSGDTTSSKNELNYQETAWIMTIISIVSMVIYTPVIVMIETWTSDRWRDMFNWKGDSDAMASLKLVGTLIWFFGIPLAPVFVFCGGYDLRKTWLLLLKEYRYLFLIMIVSSLAAICTIFTLIILIVRALL